MNDVVADAAGDLADRHGAGGAGAWNDPATIMKALDLGAYGIIVPLVNTAEDAAKAVAACRYPPVGMRSSGPGARRALRRRRLRGPCQRRDRRHGHDRDEGGPRQPRRASAPRRGSTPSTSGPPTCRSRWDWPRAATTRTRCIWPPATRSATRRTRHGIKACMHCAERGVRGGRGEARLRPGHADVRPVVHDRRRAPRSSTTSRPGRPREGARRGACGCPRCGGPCRGRPRSRSAGRRRGPRRASDRFQESSLTTRSGAPSGSICVRRRDEAFAPGPWLRRAGGAGVAGCCALTSGWATDQ